VPAFAYIASVNCILYQGATPVFVDVDSQTYNISPEAIKQKITSRTKGIVAIDYAGHAAAWDELRQIAEQHSLCLVEDAAPALGGSYHGKALGTLGDVGITSFHAAKTFTTVEGGMLFMRDAELAKRARMIRSHGESFEEKYRHVELGHNYRMTDLHAAIGLGQFSRYDKIVESRRSAADYYSKNLVDVPGLVVPHILPGNQHAWFLYPLLIEKRDKVRASLAENGIVTNISWPYPAYRQPYLERYFQESCPVAERLCNTVLCLPLYYEITQAEQDIVIQSLKEAVES
jgi:perosamine synthetase